MPAKYWVCHCLHTYRCFHESICLHHWNWLVYKFILRNPLQQITQRNHSNTQSKKQMLTNPMKFITPLTILGICSFSSVFGQTNAKAEFKFRENTNKSVVACNHVLQGTPALLVIHDGDGDWQFLCGKDGHTEQDIKIVALKQVVDIDPTLNQLYKMGKRKSAIRSSATATWQVSKLQ